jgi:hypothetical protein
MSSFGQYLDSVSLPIVTNVLVGLGVGTLTFTGATALLNSAVASVNANFSLLPSQIASLLALAGFPPALGLVLGAYSMRLSMVAMKKFVLIS